MSKNKQQPSFDENAISNDRVEIVSQPLPRVSQAISQFQVKADETLAQSVQNSEIEIKLQRNRTQRSIARTDVPLVKSTVTQETRELTEKKLKEQELAKLDEGYAKIAEDKEKSKILQHVKSVDEDARIAQQLYMEEMERQQEEEKQRLLREQQDAVIARQLSEEMTYSGPKQFQRSQSSRLPEGNAVMTLPSDTGRNRSLKAASVGDTYPTYDVLPPVRVAEQHQQSGAAYAGVTERFGQLHVDDNEKNESVYASRIERSTNADEDVDDEAVARNLHEAELQHGATMSREMLKRIEEQDAKLARMLFEKDKQATSRQGQGGDAATLSDEQLALVLQEEEQRQAQLAILYRLQQRTRSQHH